MSIVQLTDMQAIEQIVMTGDLSKLSAEQRVAYVRHVCESLGLNPATRPFQFQMFQGRLVMYATKDCSEQLRKIHRVSIRIVSRVSEPESGVYTVTVRGVDKDGKRDEASGSLSIAWLRGADLANAMMKCETKAKRRLTLSICGLGYLDESEVADMPRTAPAAAPQRPQDDRIADLNRLLTAPSTEAVVAPQAEPVQVESPAPASLEQLAEDVAALARKTGGKRTGMQALAAARKQGKDDAGTRAVLEEWHEGLTNTLNKENMR
jgi:hypothetical protein